MFETSRGKLRPTLGTVLACAVLALAHPAAATERTSPDRQEGFHRVLVREVSTSVGDPGTLSYTASCFGYTGRFRDGTKVVLFDWQTDVNECFGISPTRKIWHTWPGAGRWHEMPGNGRADHVVGGWENLDTGVRSVQVHVTSSDRYWCNTYDSGWGSWWNCT